MAHNYVLVDEEVVRPFVDHLHAAARQFFPDGARASPDLSRIVNLRHFHRIKRMLDNTRGQIVLGGQTDEDDLFIEPTAVLVDAMDDIMVQEEAFGPVFAIYPVHSLDEALNIARRVDPTPLALFACGSTAENERILNEITSGGATLNDSFFHGSVNTVPFGGVGGSGMGAYRGKASFDVWTHTRSVAETPRWMEPLIRVRYMPYKWSELRRLRLLNGGGTPDFDRNGRVVRGFRYWVAFVLRLGAPGVKGALLRWLFLLAAGYVAALRRSL
ncbi:hypothetical protein VTK73DRAFT_5598 [Phialemonium thermophilum]|uniref:Aldehyde dehydrogenase domain-containing protein n=1 Tax=Phialemonium thermophilum TaxID=223376 RepID=A0ABR3V1A3_9PEZI